MKAHELEKKVEDPVRGVGIRRTLVGAKGNFKEALKMLPYRDYDYSKVPVQRVNIFVHRRADE